MSTLTQQDVQDIIERVRRRLGEAGSHPGEGLRGAEALSASAEAELGEGIFPTIDEAVGGAALAFDAYRGIGMQGRKAIVSSIRASMLEHNERLAEMAVAETGLGRVADKIVKNRLVATEFAPFGVVAAITPTTNPTSTIINNTISILSAGNSLVFNVHPNARKVSAENVRLINRAVVAAGGPANLVTATPEPTIASAQELMNHPTVRLILVTGGPAVVREALKTDKRSVTAGPGNPPSVVDQTADIEKAGSDIVRGASFDNNVICTDEKTAIVVDTVADRLVRAMAASGAHVLKDHELRRLERVIFTELGPPNKPGHINPKWIGKNASVILAEIGVRAGDDLRLVVAEVPNEHSLVWTEQMMPVMPVTRVSTVDQAIDLAVRSEHGFRHTASIHSTNVDAITRMGRAMNCSIFVANGPNFAGLGEGGEGFTSFSIATPTGDGMTRPRTFSRERRIAVVGSLRIV